MITSCFIFRGNNTVVEVQDLLDVATNAYLDDATVTMTLYDRDGQEVANEIWPVTLSYVSGTNSTYRAVLDSQLDVTPGSHYTAVVEAVTADMVHGKWEVDVFAQVRRG